MHIRTSPSHRLTKIKQQINKTRLLACVHLLHLLFFLSGNDDEEDADEDGDGCLFDSIGTR